MTVKRVSTFALTIFATTAVGFGVFILSPAMESVAGSAGAGATTGENAQPKIMAFSAPPKPAAFSVDDGAFYSQESLFVPLAMADISDEQAQELSIDLRQARDVAVLMDALNFALAETGFKTYRRYAAAVAEGRQAPNTSVERAHEAAAKLGPQDSLNLRRTLDHLAL